MDVQYQPTCSSKKDDGKLHPIHLTSPIHHLNKCQNLATNHQKEMVDRYKRLILSHVPPQDIIIPHESSLKSLKECVKWFYMFCMNKHMLCLTLICKTILVLLLSLESQKILFELTSNISQKKIRNVVKNQWMHNSHIRSYSTE